MFTPWFSLAMLVLASLVIYGLAVTSEYREEGPPPASPAI
jgi:hypothetical protein